MIVWCGGVVRTWVRWLVRWLARWLVRWYDGWCVGTILGTLVWWLVQCLVCGYDGWYYSWYVGTLAQWPYNAAYMLVRWLVRWSVRCCDHTVQWLLPWLVKGYHHISSTMSLLWLSSTIFWFRCWTNNSLGSFDSNDSSWDFMLSFKLRKAHGQWRPLVHIVLICRQLQCLVNEGTIVDGLAWSLDHCCIKLYQYIWWVYMECSS